jgi:hypothetical protein
MTDTPYDLEEDEKLLGVPMVFSFKVYCKGTGVVTPPEEKEGDK